MLLLLLLPLLLVLLLLVRRCCCCCCCWDSWLQYVGGLLLLLPPATTPMAERETKFKKLSVPARRIRGQATSVSNRRTGERNVIINGNTNKNNSETRLPCG